MKPVLACVLHAHLPWVRKPELTHALEERWLFDALWASYLPLVELCDALAARRPSAPLFTLSLSPPLLAMLRDGLLCARFARHLAELDALNARARARLGPAFAPAADDCARRFAAAARTWARIDGDVPAAFARARAAGAIELWTTSASHAFLPGLAPVSGAARMQLRLGRDVFAQAFGFAPDGLWLPECGFVPALDAELAALGVRATVLDGHALGASGASADARPATQRAESGVVYFGRDTAACHEVWSREHGFPGDSAYREFFWDVGFELDAADLGALAAPAGARAMTGLKLRRVTSRGSDEKLPYDPRLARERARAHAEEFVRTRVAAHALDRAEPCVLAFDAELFGHFWLEGPDFLGDVFALAAEQGLELVSLGAYAARRPCAAAGMPRASSWGRGGYSQPWLGPETAGLWRHIHAAHRAVAAALRAPGAGARPELDEAIRELLLLEASDWLFMVDGGSYAGYARARLAAHRARVFERLALGRTTLAEAGRAPEPYVPSGFLADVSSATLRRAWS